MERGDKKRMHGAGRKTASLAVGVGSLLWLLLRTGRKPSRAAYPCQQAAMANASAWIGTLALPALWGASARLNRPGATSIRTTGLRLSAFLAAALAIAGITPPALELLSKAAPAGTEQTLRLELAGRQQPASGYSDIFVVQGTTGADGGFQRLVEIMSKGGLPFYSLVGPRDVVIIKVNSQWDERGGTNTDLVRAIIESILKHPRGFDGEIVIADNGQAQYGASGRGGSLDWKASNAENRNRGRLGNRQSQSRNHRCLLANW